MKKCLSVLLITVITLLLTAAGCSDDNSQEDKNATPPPTTTAVAFHTTETQKATGAEGTSTVNNKPSVYIYDGTGEKQGEKIATVKWSDTDKITTINKMIQTDGVISSDKKEKKDTSKASKVYLFELINNYTDNNLFYVYFIGDKVYLYSDKFSSDAKAFVNGYADVSQDEVMAIIEN